MPRNKGISTILVTKCRMMEILFCYLGNKSTALFGKGYATQFYMEGHHDAIVSREDFEAVAALVEQRAKERTPRSMNGF